MPRVAILSPSFTTADAVTNDALGMSAALTRHGFDVRLFCESHSLPISGIREISRVSGFLKDPGDILLYHYSRGWLPALELVQQLKCRRVIRYHNITPARFFAGFSSHDQEVCEMGRRQLVDLTAAQCDLYLSASAFSARELIELGLDASRSRVVPPFHRTDRLTEIEPDETTIAKYRNGAAGILSVGRVLPHKGQLQLIEIFAHYYHHYNRNSRLFIVGKGGEGFSPYSKLLHRTVERFGLNDAVVFTGAVSDEALKAYYLLADAFVAVSEHEGFCVPLVEAMAMKLPITAFSSTAIPETVGDAGIVWDERNPLLIVESIDRLIRDNSVSTGLGLRGLRRYEQMFTNEKIERCFLEALSTL
jgi:glycosyltransferase involved in cell wall biosynthesis